MTAVRRNTIANFLGNGWTALMGLIFVPVYIKYLGVEAYVLIGVFIVLQTWLSLLDFGMAPTLSREMARFNAGAHSDQSIRNLFHSLETIYLGMAIIIGCINTVAAGPVARDWLRAEQLSFDTVANALVVMGWGAAFRWMTALYRGALQGLQRQVLLNWLSASFATVRGAGAIAVLAFVSPTIVAFFAWQTVLGALEAAALGWQLRRSLPCGQVPARFSFEEIRKVWHFAGGVFVISLLGVALTQIDKVLLSWLLALSEFGYYTLAVSVATALGMITGPISNATYPHMTILASADRTAALSNFYHNPVLSHFVGPQKVVPSYAFKASRTGPVSSEPAFSIASCRSRPA
jgi:O-antigen/teichoic acid export membrane protein